LGRAEIGAAVLLPIQHDHVQALSDEPQQRPIRDPSLEHLDKRLAIDAVERRHDTLPISKGIRLK
jgi:hypothetical protein